MSSPNEKSRREPLREYHSGTFVRASSIREDKEPHPPTAPALRLIAVRRYPWDEVAITTPLEIEHAAVPMLAAHAMNYLAHDFDGMERVLARMAPDAVERLAMAVRNQAAEDAAEQADRADNAVKAAAEAQS